MHLLVIFSGEIERSVNIVVGLVIMLDIRSIKSQNQYLLSKAKVQPASTHLQS